MQLIEQLESRCLLASFTATSVAELIADINAANAAGGSNTITLAAGTTFKLNAVVNGFNGSNGLPQISAGDNLTIIGNANTIQRSTTRGTPAFRLFNIDYGASLTLNNLTLSGGLSDGGSGGGLYNDGT